MAQARTGAVALLAAVVVLSAPVGIANLWPEREGRVGRTQENRLSLIAEGQEDDVGWSLRYGRTRFQGLGPDECLILRLGNESFCEPEPNLSPSPRPKDHFKVILSYSQSLKRSFVMGEVAEGADRVVVRLKGGGAQDVNYFAGPPEIPGDYFIAFLPRPKVSGVVAAGIRGGEYHKVARFTVGPDGSETTMVVGR
jgi:hypothetical protein